VSELGPEDVFIFRSERYVWIRKNLKRIECQQLATNRMYRFRADVRVLPAGKQEPSQPALSQPTLRQLAIGQTFELAGRRFRLMEMKRKNAVCRDLDNGRDYLISGIAPVENVSPV
jgi:hypothetical protein